MHQTGLADGDDVESHVIEGLMVEQVPPVEEEGRLGHGEVDSLAVQLPVVLPVGDQGDGVGALGGPVGIGKVQAPQPVSIALP